MKLIKWVLLGFVLGVASLSLLYFTLGNSESEEPIKDKEVTQNQEEFHLEIDKLTQENKRLLEQLTLFEQSEVPTKESETSADNELESINETIQKFMKTFDNVSTEDFEERLPELYPLMTKQAQKNLVPYYKEDANLEKISASLESSKDYVLFLSDSKAQVVSLAAVHKAFNDKYAYLNLTIIQTTLLKEDGTWKVDTRKHYVVNEQFPKDMFN